MSVPIPKNYCSDILLCRPRLPRNKKPSFVLLISAWLFPRICLARGAQIQLHKIRQLRQSIYRPIASQSSPSGQHTQLEYHFQPIGAAYAKGNVWLQVATLFGAGQQKVQLMIRTGRSV